METGLNDFDEFWKVYPRRVAKQAAMRMYKRALKLTTADVILHGARCYARERAGQDSAFTKHPSTWLNGGCWDDYTASLAQLPAKGENNAPVAFYAAFTSPELDAWESYGKATNGRGYPRDKKGGWYFPTRWPPGYQPKSSTATSPAVSR